MPSRVMPLVVDIRCEGVFTGVAKWAVPNVVAETDGFRQGFIESEISGERAADLRHLKRVSETGHKVITIRVHEDLSLVLQASEGLGVEDAVPVAFERCPPLISGFGSLSTPSTHGMRRQR